LIDYRLEIKSLAVIIEATIQLGAVTNLV